MSSPAAEGTRLVLGTAGHIDHGKTSLVRALTGTDCDRLPEEKDRGITIELGFARLAIEGGERRALECSVIDVPGHEKLVRTMVSGATGIDVVLLVVAADEGVMPQTREHVAVCDLLGIESGVVAVTKADLVDEETCELAAAEIEDLLSSTGLADAPVVAVSSESGSGIDGLRAELVRALAAAAARTPREGPPRLAVDRAFAMKGFGTVVTGTLLGNALSVGDSVVLHSSERGAAASGRSAAREHAARVRGLQAHGEAVERIEPGGRCAVNLQGIEVNDVSRGDVLTEPGALEPTESFDVQLRWLATPPHFSPHVSVELLAGSSERRARVAPIGDPPVAPGELHFARIHVDDGALAILPGDRFVIRGFARGAQAGATLGGGQVIDVKPPRRRRSDAALREELERIIGGQSQDAVRERVLRSGLAGVREEALSRELGWEREPLRSELGRLAEQQILVECGDALWLSAAATERIEKELCRHVGDYHAAEPLRPGIARARLLGALPDNVETAAAETALARLHAQGLLEFDAKTVREAGFAPKIDADTERELTRIREGAAAAGLDAASMREWAEQLDLSPERFRDLAAHLERSGELVPASGGDLWFSAEAIEDLRRRVIEHLGANETLDTAAYKQLTGTSRRTTVPLMELLDDWKVTRRRGDVRVAGPAGRDREDGDSSSSEDSQ